MACVLKTENLTYLYNAGIPTKAVAIKDVNIEIEQGEIVGIIGHTGSGKSTLVSHFNGLLKPTSGKVLLDGVDIWTDKETAKNSRFKVGLCFQYPEYQLFEETVYKDIAFGPKNMKLKNDEIEKRVFEAAYFVGLKKELLRKSPFDLSGGEKRRAAIAGVMAMKPEVLILDEPTAGLDPVGRDTILSMIKNYRKKTGCTIILVSHSMEDVAGIATKVLVMNNSKAVMYGNVNEVYSKYEQLQNMGLNVPEVTRIFARLKAGGLKVSENIYTVRDGKNELLNLFGVAK